MELQNLWIFGLHNPHAVSLLQCIFADCKPDSVVKLLKHLLKLSFSCHMPCQSYLSVECWVHMPLNVKKCKNFHVFKMRCLRSLTTESGLQSTKIHCKSGTATACSTLHSGRIGMWHENDDFKRCLMSLTIESGLRSAKIHCKSCILCGLCSPKTQLWNLQGYTSDQTKKNLLCHML